MQYVCKELMMMMMITMMMMMMMILDDDEDNGVKYLHHTRFSCNIEIISCAQIRS